MNLPLPRVSPGLVVWAAWLALAGAPTGRPADGPALFADNCASCHGIDGKGRTPAGKKVHAKDLTLSTLTDTEIGQQIREGKKDDRGRMAMPSFKENLSDAEISALVAVVKEFRK